MSSASTGSRTVSNLRNIILNTGWLLADKVLALGVGLVVSVWMARYLGPEQFGLLNFCIAFVSLFAVVSKLGLDGIVVRDLVRLDPFKGELLGTAFVLKLIGGFLIVGATVPVIMNLRPNDYMIWVFIAIISSAAVPRAFEVIDFWFQAQVRSVYSVFSRQAAFLVVAMLKAALILAKAPLIFFVLALFIESVLGAVGLIVAYLYRGCRIRAWRISWRRAKQLLKDSWPLVLSGLAIAVYMHIDQIMLGEMVGNTAVGIYSAAARLSNVWYFIPVAILSSLYPSFLQTKQANEDRYRRLLQKVFNLMSSLAYIIAIPVSLTSAWLIALLFGQEYAGAAPILAIHIWAGLFVFFGIARERWLITEGLTKFSFATTAVGAASNVLLNYILIPHYGAVGAAVSTLVSYAIAVLLSCVFYERTRPIAFVMMKALVLQK